MKKKLLAIILSGAFVLGAGTVAFAATNDGDGNWSFDKLLPFMQEMHPNSSQEDLEEMYDSCHGEDGMMQDYNSQNTKAQSMMNNF